MSTHSPAQRRAPGSDTPPPTSAAPSLGPCIAGIGASAGGGDAIRQFFQAMPDNTGVAFVVVQHPDPTHLSLAAELFAKFTDMPVKEASDDLLVQANHVYTSPSDKEVSIQRGRLRLTPRGNRGTLQLPIDHFFSSLGNDLGTRAMGVVLSGMGTDGALGLKSIAAHGGIVLVQDPKTAEYDGMPRSAIAAGIANYVLPVDQMPRVIADYARPPDASSAPDGTLPGHEPRAIQRLIEVIHKQRGYDFSGYKRGTLTRRIERRMGLRGMDTLTRYVDLLTREPAEVDALFRDLMIGVTEFFRDPLAWKMLEAEIIAPLVAAKRDDEPIRIWVPGCSTGEEAYTLGILVLEHLRRAKKTCPVQIFATDTNNDALEVGRCGRYPVGISARMSASRLKRYLVADTSQQHFTVSPALRASVIFGLQNLFSDPPFGRVDLISCRNVLIYLEPALQKRVLNIFHFALNPQGTLFLGSAESNGSRDEMFQPLSKKWRIFRRMGNTPTELLNLPQRVGDVRASALMGASRPTPPLSQVASIAQKLILDRFAPACVLIDARHEALYYCGPTDDYLLRPRGAPVQNLLLLVREGLRSRLRAALNESATQQITVSVTGARMKHGEAFLPVEITVTPHVLADSGTLFLVAFRPDLTPALVPPNGSPQSSLVHHLQEELQATRDDLKYTIERFETSAEDLKISNEEVVTTNEELRSLNEELESSKEELQSLNEELTTVNQQLEVKLHELKVSNTDLNSLLNSSDIATLCIDRSFAIKWFTPAAQTLFKFLPGDIGRSVNDFSLAQGGGGLVEAANAVMDSQQTSQQEFQTENGRRQTESGRRYVRRIMPYRNEHGTVNGVIITLTDITASYQAAESAALARQDLQDSRAQNEKLRSLSAALAMAETRERRRLAQDLHDDLGQMLALIKLKIAAIDKLQVPDFMRAAMLDCSKAVDQANRQVRIMAFQLNPPMLDELGLSAGIEWIADEMHKMYQLEVHTEDDGLPKPLDPAISTTLFRAVRELLINTAKHAHVKTATVNLDRVEGHHLMITVSDAGAGFDADQVPATDGQGGFGLLSVRERIRLLGGEVSIRSTPGEGTTVFIKVPLAEQAGPPEPTSGAPS